MLNSNLYTQTSGLYFDGKKDKTRKKSKEGKEEMTEVDNITMVTQPNGEILGFCCPEDKSTGM